MTTKVKETVGTAKRVYKNACRLIEAAALVIVAGYALKHVWPHGNFSASDIVVLVAGVLIALRGAFEFLGYLAKES